MEFHAFVEVLTAGVTPIGEETRIIEVSCVLNSSGAGNTDSGPPVVVCSPAAVCFRVVEPKTLGCTLRLRVIIPLGHFQSNLAAARGATERIKHILRNC